MNQDPGPDPFLNVLAALLAVAGLVILAPQSAKAALIAGRLALACAIWVVIWTFAMPLVSDALQNMPPRDVGSWSVLAVNLGLATLSWLPAAAVVLATRRGATMPALPAMLFGLLWMAGFVLPGLGQGGLWSLPSLGLAAGCGALSAALGLMSALRQGRVG